MKSLLIAGVAIVAISSSMNAGAADFPHRLRAGDKELTLNGWGTRNKNFLQLYEGGLYLTERSQESEAIITADDPMAIRIHITSRFVSQEKLVASLNEGFRKSTNGNLAPISNELNQFRRCLAERITRGDIVDIVYVPSKGIVVTKNRVQKGVIEGLAFKKALFGIWLSDTPADRALKLGMLGKSSQHTVGRQPGNQRLR